MNVTYISMHTLWISPALRVWQYIFCVCVCVCGLPERLYLFGTFPIHRTNGSLPRFSMARAMIGVVVSVWYFVHILRLVCMRFCSFKLKRSSFAVSSCICSRCSVSLSLFSPSLFLSLSSSPSVSFIHFLLLAWHSTRQHVSSVFFLFGAVVSLLWRNK